MEMHPMMSKRDLTTNLTSNLASDAVLTSDASAKSNSSEAQLRDQVTALRHQILDLQRQVQLLESQAIGQPEKSQSATAGTAQESANRIKNEFLTVLSHELRTPLNPILGWAKMLRSRQFSPEMTDRALAAIERNAQLQVQLIEDLLDVSHILQGKLQLNISTVNLVAVVEAGLETARLAADSKLIALEFAANQEPIWLAGDQARLQQVIWNLLANAVKFTPSGGKVQISLQKQDSEHPAVQLSVSDTGQGINPDFLPHIFDYFRQAESAVTRQFGGLGLGLTIVRYLVELHGGSIEAESLGEDQGATFRVTLPLLKQLPQPAPRPIPDLAEPLLNSLDQIRILVVEDHPDMRDFAGVILREAGARVILASSAGEALAKLSRFQPQLLICDIGLPDVDGCSLLRQIRTLVPELGGNVPAIALTAYAGECNQQEILAAGFQLYIAKPVEPQVLVTAAIRLSSMVAN
jgi:signal transduction histidine kinase/ActR/RegA family two-component response regulator